MTLIEQANIFNKTNHQNLFFDQNFSKKNVIVYSSQHLIPITKQTKNHRSEKFILPPIDKDDNRYRRKNKRPSYRTSIYHSNTAVSSQIDLSSLTARGKKPELITTIKDDDTVMNLRRHHAPPPSPSDSHIERLLAEFNCSGQSTPQSTTVIDGYIPYRLPALNQSALRRRTELNIPPKYIKSTLSNYLQRFY